MPKIKTHQATAKRFRFTRRKKIMRRKGGQDHFNARETGKTRMGKRRDQDVDQRDHSAINRLVPYHD